MTYFQSDSDKVEKDKLEKDILNDFALRNQYSNWKQIIKDNQSMTFDAKEFEVVILEVIKLTKLSQRKEDIEMFEKILEGVSNESTAEWIRKELKQKLKEKKE
jgi:hypothetical protein